MPLIDPIQSQLAIDEDNRKKAVAEYILKSRQASEDDGAASEAEASQNNRNQMIASVAQAIEGAARADSVSRGGAGTDPSIYNSIRANSQQNIKDLIAARHRKRESMSQEYSIGADSAKASNDSLKAQHDVGNDLKTQTRADEKLQLDAKNTGIEQTEAERSHKANEANSRDNNMRTTEASKLIHEDAQKARELALEDRAAARQDSDYNKHEIQLGKDLESFRGNRAVNQANLNKLSAANALDIVKGKKFLTTQDLNLLASEVSKIATNGVPTESGIQHLMPHNLETKAAEIKNFLTSSPTDAQANDYIQRNLQYIKALKKESERMVSTFQSNTMKTYSSGNKVRPEFLEMKRKDYKLNDKLEYQPEEEGDAATTNTAPLSQDEATELQSLRAKYGR